MPVSDAEVTEHVLHMAALQECLNLQIHSHWRTQGYAYYRAIWVECAELLDHYGWKWWKRQDADLDQVRLEIVDIWHFGLSQLLREGRVDARAGRVAPEVVSAMRLPDVHKDEDFPRSVERLAESSLVGRGFDVPAFASLLASLPMRLDELHGLYMGKNLLNRFRQSQGYQEGRYVKVWQGREDNEHLVDVLATLDPLDADFEASLMLALERRYAEREADSSL